MGTPIRDTLIFCFTFRASFSISAIFRISASRSPLSISEFNSCASLRSFAVSETMDFCRSALSAFNCFEANSGSTSSVLLSNGFCRYLVPGADCPAGRTLAAQKRSKISSHGQGEMRRRVILDRFRDRFRDQFGDQLWRPLLSTGMFKASVMENHLGF